MIQITVAGMSLDERTGSPVVLLLVPPEEKCLPIWIGPAEAASIALALRGEKFQRPLTHDLMTMVIDGLEGKVDRVVVIDQRDGTYYAKLFLSRDQEMIGIDARPSDCIALALRTGSPIYLAEEVLEAVRDSLVPIDVLHRKDDDEEGDEP